LKLIKSGNYFILQHINLYSHNSYGVLFIPGPPNSAFSQLNGCCTILEEEDGGCIDSWQRVNGYFMSFVYYDRACNEVHFDVNTRNTQLGENPLLAITTFAESYESAPHMMTTLRDVFPASKKASISIDMAYFSWYPDSLKDEHLLSFYGIHDLNQLSGINQDTALCNSDISYELLGVPSVSQLELNTLKEIVINFTPQRNIEAVLLSQNCNFLRDDVSQGVTNFVNSLDIIPFLRSDFLYSEIVCNDIITITAYIDTFDSYQWYVDSMPIGGANESFFDFDPRIYDNSAIHLEVKGGNNCALLGPLNSEFDFPIDRMRDTAWICDGDSFDFNGIQLAEEGQYRDTLVNQFGCDSTVTLELVKYPIQSEVPVIQEIICLGSTYEFHNTSFDSAGNYDIILLDQYGCDSIITLSLTEESVRAKDTLFVSISEGDDYTFGDMSYNNSGVFEYLNMDSTECGVLEILSLEVIREAAIQDAVFIPNVFSPNGDRINDELIISFDPAVVGHIDKIAIYNRWGNVVYSSSETLKWDGRINDSEVGSSVYICVVDITLRSGHSTTVAGSVQVMR